MTELVTEKFALAHEGMLLGIRAALKTLGLPLDEYCQVHNRIHAAIAMRMLGPEGTVTPTKEDYERQANG